MERRTASLCIALDLWRRARDIAPVSGDRWVRAIGLGRRCRVWERLVGFGACTRRSFPQRTVRNR